MAIYLIPIKTAMIAFPFLAALFTMPYVIVQYRKYGSILLLRTAIIYSFIFYILCAYLLTMLPLPDPESVAELTTPTMQLIPFTALTTFLENTPFMLNDLSTYLPALNQPSFYVLLFNLLLLMPFGIYMRYYFQYSWKKTLLLTFLLSLSFECIQRSALFGIYPRPYRMFDIDDLITNTLGGMLGYLVAPLAAKILPTRDELDQSAYRKGMQISIIRKGFAFLIDLAFLSMGMMLIVTYDIMLHQTTDYEMMIVGYLILIWILYILIPIITKGKTIGKFFVRIRIIQTNGNTAKWYQYLLHYGILYGLILPMPFLIYYLVAQFLLITSTERIFYLISALAASGFFLFSIGQIVISLIDSRYIPYYSRLSKLHTISTVVNQTSEQEDHHSSQTNHTDSNEVIVKTKDRIKQESSDKNPSNNTVDINEEQAKDAEI